MTYSNKRRWALIIVIWANVVHTNGVHHHSGNSTSYHAQKHQNNTLAASKRVTSFAIKAQCLNSTPTLIEASKKVEILYSNRMLRADYVRYDKVRKVYDARGSVTLYSPNNLLLRARSAQLNHTLNQGALNNVTAATTSGVLTAQKATINKKNNDVFYTFEYASFTPCPLCANGSSAWSVHAAKLQHHPDHIDIHEGHIRFADTPLLYTPFWSFATKPKSGWLQPYVGRKNHAGWFMRLPYYVLKQNSSSTYDCTIAPSFGSKSKANRLDIEHRLRHHKGLYRFIVQAGINATRHTERKAMDAYGHIKGLWRPQNASSHALWVREYFFTKADYHGLYNNAMYRPIKAHAAFFASRTAYEVLKPHGYYSIEMLRYSPLSFQQQAQPVSAPFVLPYIKWRRHYALNASKTIANQYGHHQSSRNFASKNALSCEGDITFISRKNGQNLRRFFHEYTYHGHHRLGSKHRWHLYLGVRQAIYHQKYLISSKFWPTHLEQTTHLASRKTPRARAWLRTMPFVGMRYNYSIYKQSLIYAPFIGLHGGLPTKNPSFFQTEDSISTQWNTATINANPKRLSGVDHMDHGIHVPYGLRVHHHPTKTWIMLCQQYLAAHVPTSTHKMKGRFSPVALNAGMEPLRYITLYSENYINPRHSKPMRHSLRLGYDDGSFALQTGYYYAHKESRYNNDPFAQQYFIEMAKKITNTWGTQLRLDLAKQWQKPGWYRPLLEIKAIYRNPCLRLECGVKRLKNVSAKGEWGFSFSVQTDTSHPTTPFNTNHDRFVQVYQNNRTAQQHFSAPNL